MFKELTKLSEGKSEIYDSIDSTNNRAKLLAKMGCDDGFVVVADTQISGRGQKGRSFFCEKGLGLYMSIVLKPDIKPEEAIKITAFAAVATAEAIESLVPCDIKIKWVNDLYLNGKKLCGILTEGQAENGKLKYAVVGIGVNTGRISFPDELVSIATSVFNETGVLISRDRLACEIIKRLKAADESYMERYRQRSCVIGKHVRILSGNREIEAEIMDIDKNGFLVVKDDEDTFTVNAGEVIMRRK